MDNDQRTPVEKRIARSFEDDESQGKPLSRRARQTAGADRLVVERDQQRELVLALGDLRDEGFGIGLPVRVGNARRVLGDTTVVGEKRNGFGVLEARRPQREPLGLEDEGTAFPQNLGRNFL